MAKRGAHSAQAHAAGTAMGVGTDMVERWNFVQVVYVEFLQQVQIQSRCWPVAELERSALAGSLFGLNHCKRGAEGSFCTKRQTELCTTDA